MSVPDTRYHTFVVALTGGIASGKTAVSSIFKEFGVPIIDTDEIARELAEPDGQAFKEIVKTFGNEMLMPDGRLDRKKLRKLIFSDNDQKAALEKILHPAILVEVQNRISELDAPYTILVVPLLAESNSYGWVDRVLVVDTSLQSQIDRLSARDGLDYKDALKIIKSQSKREERLAIADDIIVNKKDVLALRQQVINLHEKYEDLARADLVI